MFENTGPLRNSNLDGPPCADSSITTVPMMSAGIRSGVNWMRENSSANDSASVRTSIVLPRPGTPSSKACEAGQHAGDDAVDDLTVADDDARDFFAQRADVLGERRYFLAGFFDWLAHCWLRGVRS